MGNNRGWTLIELVIVIIILGIIAGVAIRNMGGAISSAQVEHTKTELDNLAAAIVGNPASYSLGSRADFGYVGDIGALPPNLSALVANPGGYSTWNGPYLEQGVTGADYRKDAWGADYQLSGATLRSVGSGANIDKQFANSIAELTSDTLIGTICDANLTRPGTGYKDSIKILLAYPDGSGSTATVTTFPDKLGRFTIPNIPIGNRQLRVIYLPATDTLTIPVTVCPGKISKLDVIFPADLF
ncbi:MAG: prepilin-type N-terminal cleavage/methylation domain-containing protein [candidate division Zixibacteria bacterium]|nr:prepilin-type N-terminal cleavage/methylation domain-containing protein [candidate division Zixibacteria bacterium]